MQKGDTKDLLVNTIQCIIIPLIRRNIMLVAKFDGLNFDSISNDLGIQIHVVLYRDNSWIEVCLDINKISHSYQFNHTNDPQNDDEVKIDASEIVTTNTYYEEFAVGTVIDASEGVKYVEHQPISIDESIVSQINQILIEQAEEEFKADKGL